MDENVEVRDVSVQEVVDAMIEGGIDKESAHSRMRDAVRSMNCSHEWINETDCSVECRKCGSTRVSDVFKYFGVERPKAE